ncbi:MAG: tetratricopeptide repeat protein [Candidatus Omnitrophica bacterium]|nr:tetratricopeptide repeat protein [Candidatus Omnitrophota bacterium]
MSHQQRFLLIGAMLIAMALAMPSRVCALEPTPGYQTIQRAFLREDFEQVTLLAENFLGHYQHVPETPRVWLWLALSLDKLQRSNEALTQFDSLKTHLAPSSVFWPEVLFWEADVSRRAFQMLRAKQAYQRLLTQYPASSWATQAQLGLGLVLLHQQAFETALGYFHETAVRQAAAPEALDALLFEGLCNLQLGRWTDAVAILQPLLDRLQDPQGIAQAAFYLGESLSGLKRYEEAMLAYQRALTAAEASRWGRLSQFGLAWAEYQRGRCQESIDGFERYLHLKGTDEHVVEALFAQGSCLIRVGREQDALARFDRILSSYPKHPLVLESGLTMAELYRRDERLDEAHELLHAMLRWPLLDELARAKVQLRLGAVALEEGNAAKAKTIFELATHSDERTVRQAAYSGLGDVQMFLGNLTEAQAQYQQAMELAADPSLVTYATYQAARIDLQLGQTERAMAVFQQMASSADAALADDAQLAIVIAYLNQREEGLAHGLLERLRRERAGTVTAARASYYDAVLALGDGDQPTAERLCQEAIQFAPRTDEAFEARLLLVNLQTREAAPDAMEKALTRWYEAGRLPRSQRGKLAKRLGDMARVRQAYPEAIQWYDNAAQLAPSISQEAAYRIASCYEEVSDLDRAMQWYGRVTQPPWRVRSQLALAKLLERQDRPAAAEAIYAQLAEESIPEAELARERLTALRQAKPQDGSRVQ